MLGLAPTSQALVSKKPLYKSFLEWLLFFLIVISVCMMGSGYYIYSRLLTILPDVKTLDHFQYQAPLRIYTRDKRLMAQFGVQKRTPVTLDQIPQPLIHAFIAAEDDRFYAHAGVDFDGLVRAGRQLVLTGEKQQGGSTITMQVARLFLLSNEKTFLRKIKEIILARKIEREYSKNHILELYLNQIYLGHRAYGVTAAAETYYGRPLTQLTLAEYAMLAGLPKAPSANNPIANETRAIQRRNYVLHRMLELGYITKSDYDGAINQPSTAKLHYQPADISAPYVAEMVRQAIFERYGEQAYTSGLNVYTTISGLLQTTADQALRNTLHGYDERHGYRSASALEDKGNFNELPVIGDTLPATVLKVKDKQVAAKLQNGTLIDIPWENIKWAVAGRKAVPSLIKTGHIIRVRRLSNQTWALAQVPEVEGAFVALDPSDGAILALTGGFDFLSSKFNRATQSKRQPGSGFKPIIYTAALEVGYTPASIFYDEPIVIIEDPFREVEWRPENYNRIYRGPIPLRTALVHSSNSVAIRLLDAIGMDNAVSTALRFGFTPRQLPLTLSLALGSGYASPLQMAQVYAAFANGGFLVKPYFIERIESGEGSILFQARPGIACPICTDSRIRTSLYAPRVMAREIHFLMNSLLGDVVQRGTAAGAKLLNRQDVAGKTGTTNDHRDAWFNGYTPSIAATAWVGFDNFKPLGKRETGSKTALPMWVEFMKTALANTPEAPVTIPNGIIEAFIDPATGQLTYEDNKAGIWEFFQADAVPRTEAVVYQDAAERENADDDNKPLPEDNGEQER